MTPAWMTPSTGWTRTICAARCRRAWGVSCDAAKLFADDGAGGRPGASYSNGLACSWTISGSGVAQVDFDVLKVWAGDAVSVYGGDAATGVLLARLSGLGAKAWPVFRYPGTITVLFETDGLDDGAFGKDFADGVSFAYDADADHRSKIQRLAGAGFAVKSDDPSPACVTRTIDF